MGKTTSVEGDEKVRTVATAHLDSPSQQPPFLGTTGPISCVTLDKSFYLFYLSEPVSSDYKMRLELASRHKNQNTYPHKRLVHDCCNSFIHNSQNLEIVQMVIIL